MSIESFARWDRRNYKTIREKYNVRYSFSFYEDTPILVGLKSYSPCKGNATKVLKIIVKAAKRHKVNVRLQASSRYVGDEAYNNHSTFKEREYIYWRALLMYQRVGFKTMYKDIFLNDSIRLYPVDLITDVMRG